jgi:membrane fusion protein, adhesin transport system
VASEIPTISIQPSDSNSSTHKDTKKNNSYNMVDSVDKQLGLKSIYSARWVLRIGFLGLAALITWAWFSEIEQITRAPGQVIAMARTQTVQAPDGGVIIKLWVKEGDVVTKGQILAQLESSRAQAAVSDSLAKVAALKINLLRLQSEVFNRPLKFPVELNHYSQYIKNHTDLYQRRKNVIQDELAALEIGLRLAKEELSIYKPLLDTGDIARIDIIKIERQVYEIQSQITNRKNRYFQDAHSEMTKVQEDLNAQEAALSDRSQLLEHTELIAPTNGIIKNIKMNTEGGVLRAGEELMQLLPNESDLIVETKLKPSEVAFIREGLPATVKLDAYDYTIFGSLKGVVHYMSADTLSEETRQGEVSYYRVQIKINNYEFKGVRAKQIKIKPGLTGSVEIKTGKRSVLWYLLKPLVKTLNEGMREK